MKYEYLKGSEKDFEGAPEWAMFLSKDKFGDLAWDEGETNAPGLRYQWVDPENGWGVQKYTEGAIGVNLSGVIAERRPITEQVWDGEGLPPVGVEVDIVDIHERLRYGQNESGEVVAHVENTAVVRMSYGLGCFEAEFLSPIRSPEDVARDEAKGIIAELCRSSASNGHSADLIYDAIAAGKIPGVKLEGK